MGFRASAACALAAVLSIAPAYEASAASACSNDAFSIDGKALSIQICDADGRGAEGTLEETLSVLGRTPLVHAVTYRRVEGTSRTIDDVALGPLGIAKTLHVTMAVRGGNVRLEHALLIPGAIPLR